MHMQHHYSTKCKLMPTSNRNAKAKYYR
uniref:Uncharacterized protein n=1 Tax=Anguilla anguilla TaxID=7936 RepID=A0A0E9QQY1_ANGAN